MSDSTGHGDIESDSQSDNRPFTEVVKSAKRKKRSPPRQQGVGQFSPGLKSNTMRMNLGGGSGLT